MYAIEASEWAPVLGDNMRANKVRSDQFTVVHSMAEEAALPEKAFFPFSRIATRELTALIHSRLMW